MGREVFMPDCRPSDADSPGKLTCNPKLVLGDGRVLAPERPVQLRIENKKAIFEDDGGAPSEVLTRLRKHIESNVLD